MIEYGVFNDEGCIHSQLYSATTAEEAAAVYRAEGDDYAIARAICPEHEEQPADTCEECAADNDERDGEDES